MRNNPSEQWIKIKLLQIQTLNKRYKKNYVDLHLCTSVHVMSKKLFVEEKKNTRRTYLFLRVENTRCSRLSTASSSISKPPPRSLPRLKLYKSRNKNRKNEKNGRKKKVCFTSRSKFMRSPVVSLLLLLRTFLFFYLSFSFLFFPFFLPWKPRSMFFQTYAYPSRKTISKRKKNREKQTEIN